MSGEIEAANRIRGLIIMASNMKKMSPMQFGTGEVAEFIDAISADLEEIAEQLEDSVDD